MSGFHFQLDRSAGRSIMLAWHKAFLCAARSGVKTFHTPEAMAPTVSLMEEEEIMLIINDVQRHQAGVFSMGELCKYCSKEFAAYPLIMSDDAQQTVYYAACAVQLATEMMVDIYTFFSPPAPYDRLFVLTAPGAGPP